MYTIKQYTCQYYCLEFKEAVNVEIAIIFIESSGRAPPPPHDLSLATTKKTRLNGMMECEVSFGRSYCYLL